MTSLNIFPKYHQVQIKKNYLECGLGLDFKTAKKKLLTDDIQDIKYHGSAATTQIVIRAKEKLKYFNENNKLVVPGPADNGADLSSTSRNPSPTLPGNNNQD